MTEDERAALAELERQLDAAWVLPVEVIWHQLSDVISVEETLFDNGKRRFRRYAELTPGIKLCTDETRSSWEAQAWKHPPQAVDFEPEG